MRPTRDLKPLKEIICAESYDYCRVHQTRLHAFILMLKHSLISAASWHCQNYQSETGFAKILTPL